LKSDTHIKPLKCYYSILETYLKHEIKYWICSIKYKNHKAFLNNRSTVHIYYIFKIEDFDQQREEI
jgi:hypothetical protein